MARVSTLDLFRRILNRLSVATVDDLVRIDAALARLDAPKSRNAPLANVVSIASHRPRRARTDRPHVTLGG